MPFDPHHTGMLALGGDDVARLLAVKPLLGALEAAFVAFSAGTCDVPPRIGARAARGMLGAMPGHLPGVGLALKAITVFPGNHAAGLPAHQGLIVLFDEHDGRPLAIMDAAHVTAMRTAGASAVSARRLARDDASALAILGAGTQARAHLAVLPAVRDFRDVRIASRTPEHAHALARGNPRARAVGSFTDAIRDADVVCCCTDAAEPVLRHDELAPGAHVISVGTGAELDRETVRRGRVFVEWRGAATEPHPAGARELQVLHPRAVTELGEVLAGTRPGRRSRAEITVYKSTGHAIEDIATARLVYDRALAEGRGSELRI
ncbi:MAG: ornithine cyclodeaminase family protein [Solirubrobacteraceae bacterium]